MLDFFDLPPEYYLTWYQWVIALVAGMVLGLSKAGIKGIGIVVVTLMALVFGGKASTGILLPLLIAGDIFAVIYYNRHTQWKYIARFLPWMVAGVLLGVYAGKDLPEEVFTYGFATIIILSAAMMFWWDKRSSKVVPNQWWFAGGMGFMAGFTTMIGNLAGAFANIFFLAMRLPKDQFIGTAAWLFFIINVFKMPFHIFVWETISLDTVPLVIRLIPGLFIGLLLGIKLVKVIRERQYRQLILALTALGAVMIFFR